MGSLDYHRTVIAYHGCDRETLRSVLDGQPLQNSERTYDWLGRGVYFWEHGPRRALEWAQAKARRGDGKVQDPAVLGAYIHLGNCFDLLDTKNTALLTEAYPLFVEYHARLRNQYARKPESSRFTERRSVFAVPRLRDDQLVSRPDWAVVSDRPRRIHRG